MIIRRDSFWFLRVYHCTLAFSFCFSKTVRFKVTDINLIILITFVLPFIDNLLLAALPTLSCTTQVKSSKFSISLWRVCSMTISSLFNILWPMINCEPFLSISSPFLYHVTNSINWPVEMQIIAGTDWLYWRFEMKGGPSTIKHDVLQY